MARRRESQVASPHPYKPRKELIPMVRFANDADLARINELRRQVNELHVQGRPDMFKPGFGAQIQAHAAGLLHADDHAIIVAERDGTIYGMACVDYVDKPETAYSRARRYYHVQELAVDAAHRRQGLARELLEFMRADARARGFARIELDVWSFNAGAVEFYEAMGFTAYRQMMELAV